MTNASAALRGWLYVPLSQVQDVNALKRTLTVTPKGFKDYEPPAPIPVYCTRVKGRIGVPIDWGLRHFPEDLEVIDYTSKGQAVSFPKRPDPNHPNAPAGQAAFMDSLHKAMLDNATVLAESGTGTGKTVSALEVSARLGRTTLIQVHLTRLLKQWVREGQDKLGLKASDIGIVQGDVCDWRDKPLVIAMMPTLSRRRYEPEFYNAFGTVWQDEVHKVGSAMLSRCLGQFNAHYKGALTATVTRTDGAHEVYLKYYGPTRAKSEQRPAPLTVYPIDYRRKKGTYTGGNRSIWIRQLIADDRRNKMLGFYLARMYDEGRDVLGVSESIDHLDKVAEVLVEQFGIPENHIGFHTNEHNDPKLKKRVKTTEEYFEWCRLHARIILGTYGTLTEGVDIPRLSGGMDLLPRAKSKQLWGRVRRTVPGKMPSVWYTPVDLDFKPFINAYHARMRDVADDKLVRLEK